ncbi:MAG: NYN domain-containing protein [Acidobacteriota bacterium]
MPYFLDGNNVIGAERHTRTPGEEDRSALEAELAGRLRGMRSSVTLFYDGPPSRTRSLGSLTIRQPGGSADEAMLREIGKAGDAGQITVVTADRGLARQSRDAGAKSVTPADFWDSFGKTPKPHAGPSKPEAKVNVDEWIEYFSNPDNRKS